MKKVERIMGGVLLVATVCFGLFYLQKQPLILRLVAGFGFGYALSRGFLGFAGSVNRAYNTGSTKLMRTLMLMFFATAAISVGILYGADVTKMDLWINPINLGLLLGGLLFGFGMVFSSCCASGVLTDLVTSLPRALITLFFFGAGVFLGFPLQNTADWINKSWFTSSTGEAIKLGGVYLPDLFKFDGFNGYLGAVILTGILCLIVVYISYLYENKRKKAGTYTGHFSEKMQENEAKKDLESESFDLSCTSLYDKLFVKSWSMKTAAMVIVGIFVLLMGTTGAGWGASTPYGHWFGRFLMLFGVSADSLASFANMKPGPFTSPFLEHPIYIQNIGILLGTSFYLLTSNRLIDTFKASLKITPKQALFYAIGGLFMGFGTRLANGCNVGALYTPIANFSLSGWIFLVVLVIGGIVGNKVAKKLNL